MKLTANQHRNIANGMFKIKQLANNAFISFKLADVNNKGTYFTNRFKK